MCPDLVIPALMGIIKHLVQLPLVYKQPPCMIYRGKCPPVQRSDYRCVAAAPLSQVHLWHGGTCPCVSRLQKRLVSTTNHVILRTRRS